MIRTAIRKTFVWGLFNTAFGVAPVLILWALRHLPLKTETINFLNLAYIKLIDDGAINFFFLAITGAATVDLILARRDFEGDFAWIMIGLGCLAVVLIIFFYMAFLLGGDEQHTFGQAKGIFWATAIFTLWFCAQVKYTLTLKDLSRTNRRHK